MSGSDICLHPLEDVANMIRRRKVSPVEVTRSVLQRIEDLNRRLNCYITILDEQALRDAQETEHLLRAGTYLGPLHGIPISLKDSIATANVRTTAGSPILANWVPEVDATVAERLHTAGAVLVGKANLYEFAYAAVNPKYGLTHNPWSFDHISGGTSSGSASAVAAGLCYGSIGTDAAGSIRIPAAFCGTVGLSPTCGLVSRSGTIPGSSNLDRVGPLARTVRDAAVLLQAIAGFDPADSSTLHWPVPDYMASIEDGVSGLRLGVLSLQDSEPIDPEVRAAFQQACTLLEQEGAVLSNISLPDPILARTVMWTIFAPEVAEYHRSYLRTMATELHPVLRTMLEAGEFIPATHYVRAQRVRRRMIEEVRSCFAEVDAMVLPAVPMPAFPIAQATSYLGMPTGPIDQSASHVDDPKVEIEELLELKTRYTVLFNLTGQPAMVLPCGFSSNGLPIGLQIVGKPLEESMVFRVARAYERITDWHQEHPAL